MHTQNNLIRILRVAFEPSTGPENTNRYSDTPGLNIEKQKNIQQYDDCLTFIYCCFEIFTVINRYPLL